MTTRSPIDCFAVPALLLALLATLGPLYAEDDVLRIELKPQHRVMGTLVQYYRSLRIALRDKPQETLAAEPDYVSEKPRYGVLKLGLGDDPTVTVVVDEVDGQRKLYIDRNNNEDLTDDGDGSWSRSAGSTQTMENVQIEASYGGYTLPCTLAFYRFKERLHDHVFYYRESARVGTLRVGGQSYKVALLDENADGRYDDVKDVTLLIDLNRDGQLVGRTDSAEFHAGSEPFNVHGQVLEIASISADGKSVTLERSDADVAMKLYLNVGNTAPEFLARGLDGKPVDLKEVASQHKLVLLDFWASWCGPCRAEFPVIRKVHAQYGAQGLAIIGVNLDSTKGAAAKATEAEALDFPQVFDGQGWQNEIAQLFRVRGIPQNFLLDKDLKIVARGLRGKDLEVRLRDLLGPGDPAVATSTPAAGIGNARAAKLATVKRDTRVSLNESLSLFLGVGSVEGSGRIVQIDSGGSLVGQLDLPNTPYALAAYQDVLFAACPSAKKVFQVKSDMQMTEIGGAGFLTPVAIAVNPANGTIYVGDNDADKIFRFSADGQLGASLQINPPDNGRQNMSLAVTSEGVAMMAATSPLGVYPFKVPGGLGTARLPGDGCLAADPTSSRWAVTQTDTIKVFEGEREVASIPLPAGKRFYRAGLLAFGPGGELVTVLSSTQGTEIAQINIGKREIYPVCSWGGERLVSLALAPKMAWVIAAETNEQGDRLDLLAFDPPLPASLRPGQRLNVRVGYDLKSGPSARIFVRPLSNGKPTPGYGSHASPSHSKGHGVTQGWFTFAEPATVDQVRVTLVTGRNPAVELVAEVEARWSGEPAGPTDSPGPPPAGQEADALKRQLAGLGGLDKRGRQAFLDRVIAFIEKSDKTGAEFSLALQAVRTFETAKDHELAAHAYDTLAGIFAESKDERIGGYVEKLKGAARRNRLPGKAPELFGETLAGERFDWKSYQGKVVLIDFWATWCGPCLRELPHVKETYKQYHDRGFEIVGVSLDKDRERLGRFIGEREIPWVTLFSSDAERNGWNHPLAVHYGIMSVPTAILVDQGGRVVSLKANGDELSRWLAKLLGPATE